MRDRLLNALIAWVTEKPLQVLVGAAVFTAVACAFIPGLPIQAGHSSVMGAEHPSEQRAARFNERFGTTNLLFVLLEGGTPDRRREVVDRIAAQLKTNALVGGITGHVASEAMARHGLLFAGADALSQLSDILRSEQLGLKSLATISSTADLLETLAAQVDDGLDHGRPNSSEHSGRALVAVAKLLSELERRIADGDGHPREALGSALARQIADAIGGSAPIARGVDSRGYFAGNDGSLHVAVVRPRNLSDEPEVIVPFVDEVDGVAARVVASANTRCGAACAQAPLRMTLTGLPALVRGERAAIERDALVTTALAVLGVLSVFLFGFRSLRQLLLATVPLAVSLAGTLAFVRVALGGLNLITSAFMAIVVGLGIDYAVHFLARYNEARHQGESFLSGVRTAIQKAGPGLLTGTLTTSAAFLALTVSDFKGFAELGLISAVGVTLALCASITVIPALIAAVPSLRLPPAVGRTRGFSERVPHAIVRARIPLLAAALCLTIVTVWRGSGVAWSYDYLELLPQELTEVQAMATPEKKTTFTGAAAAVTAGSLEELARRSEQLRGKSTVGRVESILSYLPAQQDLKLETLRGLAPLVIEARDVRRRRSQEASSSTQLQHSLVSLTDTLDDAYFAAKQAQQAAAEPLKRAKRAAERLQRAIGALEGPVRAQRVASLDGELNKAIDDAVAFLDGATRVDRLDIETLAHLLPDMLSERLIGSGRYAAYVYPTRPVWEKAFMGQFVGDVRTVDAEATGFPVGHWDAGVAIERGFRNASLLAAFLLFVFLWIDFRRLRYTFLALVPLAIGLTWMWGGMGLFGLSYNYANVVAFPLVVGFGADSAVHMLHRFRQEGEKGVARVIRHTGAAILLSAITTLVGFGSLAAATHGGASSMGKVLLIGMTVCLLTSTLVLPTVLALIYRERPRQKPTKPLKTVQAT